MTIFSLATDSTVPKAADDIKLKQPFALINRQPQQAFV
jgi:hypothetical protein